MVEDFNFFTHISIFKKYVIFLKSFNSESIKCL